MKLPRHRIRVVVVSSLVIAAPASARAAVLTLDEAVRRAEAASPLVLRARAEREQVAARQVGAARLLPSNPVASVVGGRRREADPGAPTLDGAAFGLRLEQTFEVGGQRGARLEEVSRALRAADIRERLAKIETRARVKVAYAAVTLGQLAVEAAREREQLAHRVRQSVEARGEAGAASAIEEQLAAAEVARVRRGRLAAELALADAKNGLRPLIGAPAGEELTVSAGAPGAAAPHGTLSELIEGAARLRLELQEIEATDRELDGTLLRLRREVIPNPSVFVEVIRDLPSRNYAGAGLAVPLPVVRRNQGPIAELEAARRALTVERAVVERSVAVEVERAWQAVDLLGKELRVLEDELIPAAAAALRLLDEGWRAGKFDLFRVIAASRELWESRQERIAVAGRLAAAAVELERASGTLESRK